MLRDAEGTVRRACQRRYSAWTLYARAFTGNRADADDIVRLAVRRALQSPDQPSSERRAHERVLCGIRTAAVELLRQRQESVSAGGKATTESVAESSVLSLLTDDDDTNDPRHAADVAAQELRELPKQHRRVLEQLLLRRPPLPLDAVARRRRVGVHDVSGDIEEGLDYLASAIRGAGRRPYAGGHPALKELTVYVDGALSGDEARAIVEHCRDCATCGDRLGTMMLLRSRVAKSTLAPRVPRGTRVAALVLAIAAGLVGGFVIARQLAPNPWAAHATSEPVPRWFHDFLYGYREEVAPSDMVLAEGLDLLVRGDYTSAIDKLEPLIERLNARPEASAYLGIALYMTGDLSGRTIDMLTAGTSSTRAGRISDWYLANALLLRGDVGEARRRLRGLAFVADWVGRQAEALLGRLDQAAAGRADSAVVG